MDEIGDFAGKITSLAMIGSTVLVALKVWEHIAPWTATVQLLQRVHSRVCYRPAVSGAFVFAASFSGVYRSRG